MTKIESTIEETKGVIDIWAEKNQPSWNLICFNLPEWKEILRTFLLEKGFVGVKSYEEKPLGKATREFQLMKDEVNDSGQRLISLQEKLDNENLKQIEQIDCMSKAVNQLQNQKIHKDELDDRRIQSHVDKAAKHLQGDLDKRLDKIMYEVMHL